MYINPDMTAGFSGHFPIFHLVFFVFKSLLRIVRQCTEKIAILSQNPQSHVRIMIYRKWAGRGGVAKSLNT